MLFNEQLATEETEDIMAIDTVADGGENEPEEQDAEEAEEMDMEEGEEDGEGEVEETEETPAEEEA